MAEAKGQDHWNHTSALMALIANVHRDPKKSKVLKPTDFHPHIQGKTKHDKPPKADITLLKTVFVDRHSRFVQDAVTENED